MIYCTRHPRREADFHCSRCEQGWCRECAPQTSLHNVNMVLCPECSNTLIDLYPHRIPAPFWKRLPEIFSFPFRGQGWMYVGLWPLLGLFLLGLPRIAVHLSDETLDYKDFYNVAALGLYAALTLVVFIFVLKNVFDGSTDFPRLQPRGNVFESMGAQLIIGLGSFVGLFWPVGILFMVFWTLFNQVPGGELSTAALTALLVLFSYLAFALFLLPMSFICTATFTNFAAGFNIPAILRFTGRITSEYRIFWAIGLVILGAYAAVRIFMQAFWLHSLGGIIAYYMINAELQILIAITGAYALGQLYYQTRFKLDIYVKGDEQKVFTVRGRPADMTADPDPARRKTARQEALVMAAALAASKAAGGGSTPGRAVRAAAPAGSAPFGAEETDAVISEKLKHASYLFEHGSYDQAADAFQEVYEEHPDNLSALQGRIKAAFRLNDHEFIRAHGPRLAAEFSRQRAYEALWDMYQGYRKAIPGFVFEPKEMEALAGWLEGEEHFLEAARVLRELAVTCPDDPSAPGALYRCASLLREKCDKADTAESILRAIVERYPDSEFAGKL